MHMLMSLGMAAKVEPSCCEIPEVSSLSIELKNNPSYFLLSARVSQFSKGVQNDSVYIVDNSEHLPVRTETLLSHYILKQAYKPILIACKPFNHTKFKFTCTSTATDIELDIVYHGKTKLRLLPSNETHVCLLEDCCKAFCNEADFKKGLCFNIGVLCCSEGIITCMETKLQISVRSVYSKMKNVKIVISGLRLLIR